MWAFAGSLTERCTLSFPLEHRGVSRGMRIAYHFAPQTTPGAAKLSALPGRFTICRSC